MTPGPPAGITRDEWERDLDAAFLHLVFGVGAAPALPMDFSAHPIFAVLHARWFDTLRPSVSIKEGNPQKGGKNEND